MEVEVTALINRVLCFLKKRENIVYLIFGILTTAVNWLIYLPLFYSLDLSATASHLISWTISVIFAYLTNKAYVFQSRDWSSKTILIEFVTFVSGRILTGLIEAGILALMVDYLAYSGFIWKLICSVITVVLNYLFSKLFIFTNHK